MAFRKRYRKRFRRRFRKRGGNTMWNLAKKAASGVVKYYLNPEYKFLDAASNISVVSTGSIIANMSLIAQGNGNINRDGNSIKATSWLFRCAIDINASNPARVRVVAFTDTSSAGTIPTVADVFDTIGQLVSAPINKNNGSRFHVLWDRFYMVNSDKPKVQLEVFKKMQHHIHYLDGGSTSSSLGQGPIYVAFISDQAIGTAPTAFWTSRIRFLDN